MNNYFPQKQGLYDPKFEHDACGIGFICNIKGKKSHDIINKGITILKNLTHRGGVGSDPDAGDGAGILLQMPHAFMQKVCHTEGFELPAPGDYGVGMLFLSPDKDTREQSLKRLGEIIEEEHQKLLGIRDVPVYPECIGSSAREAMPHICQVFIEKNSDIKNAMDFERKLYVIGKIAEREIRYSGAPQTDSYFYFSSLSSKTIVYKGMLTPQQVNEFYLDLKDTEMTTSIAVVHSRFSTNTFPSWERAHPNRYIIHNGEINTIRGNVNWEKAREAMFDTNAFGEDTKKIFPVINEDGSDSSMLDNYLQFLTLSGYSLPHAVMMTIPEPWENDGEMPKYKKDFYRYHACMSEPWDGPAAIAFTDGTVVGATLDRNGLRPSRYCVTSDDMVILSSEVGVIDIDESTIIKKERLLPGMMLLIDTEKGRIISDSEIKESVSKEKPYGKWLDENLLDIDKINYDKKSNGETWHDLAYSIEKNADRTMKDAAKKRALELESMFSGRTGTPDDTLPLLTKEKIFGYKWEDITGVIKPIAEKGSDVISSMGIDSPIAVLSEKPQLLYNYFKQLFAQVTNPPIDAIREKVVTSSNVYLGGESNMLNPGAENCRRILASSPILTNGELNALRCIKEDGFKAITLPALFNTDKSGDMNDACDTIFKAADIAIDKGYNIIILSDKNAGEKQAPIPALLVCAGLHHHLIRKGTRMKVSIVLETGEPREVHHMALLVGYGANAVNPYLVYDIIDEYTKSEIIETDSETAKANYKNAVTKGIISVASKMGISTMQSYQGAQIFEALGVSQKVVDKYFSGTVTRIGGITEADIENEVLVRTDTAFDPVTAAYALESGGNFKWRSNGEYHMFNPDTVYKLQMACRTGDYKLYKEYAAEMNSHQKKECTIRGLLDIKTINKPLPIEQIESVDSIVKRFKTGAMSYGSISQEAHECLAIAMNRLGGKSNSGEGGENPSRYVPEANGDSKSSAIKQVASGRFGVHIHYLNNAKEIQIKMAQGAKPGEGGHLPGGKVYPWIAKARHSTPGVSLISPPPHHDIYSIEDLAQLIHDLKNANRDARISVKLVSEAGVGTIAVGVAKGRADVILISGYDGGTGAAPRTGVRNAGLPWELGVAETHQALLMNNLRNRVVVETDGKLLTGRDVAVAALLGAEEYGFATGPLITIGCVMMRACNLDTCPVGVATQNPVLRKHFCGKPEYVENFMRFIAQDLREWMAKIGVKSINEMIGHVEYLSEKSTEENQTNPKLNGVDLSALLYQPKICTNDRERFFNTPQNHELEKSFDINTLLKVCSPALNDGKKVSASFEIRNTNRVVGTVLSSEVVRKFGPKGLADDTISLTFSGSAGQSFGAFLASGITLRLEGDCNDYMGKGLSGGKIIVVPPKKAKYKASENVITGNVALFGAIYGECYIRGIAGERFCVRNSGINAVVEGVGDHGCEYMTGGRVVVLGKTGINFAAGMSGGIAYVYDADGTFESNCNISMVKVTKLTIDHHIAEVKDMITKHFDYTNSDVAEFILNNWEEERKKFYMICPVDYKKVYDILMAEQAKGTDIEKAKLIAFETVANKKVVF